MSKLTLTIAACLALVAGVCVLELRRQAAMTRARPPVEHVDDFAPLRSRSDLVAIGGTGSMRPLIPAGVGIVAYAEVERCDFSALRQGDLVVFSTAHGNIIHQLAEKTPSGWISSGSANAGYDAGRVTADNFYGRATRIYLKK